jgi:Uma2 family endonuclease
MVIRDKLYTLAEFDQLLAAHPNRLLELIDGRINEKVVGRKHAQCVANIIGHLFIWYKQSEAQGHFGPEIHHFVDASTPFKPQPDVSFAYGGEEQPGGTVKGMPDFVVEVKSPGNSYDELREKTRLYLQYGTRLVWLVLPTPMTVEVYRADGSTATYKQGQTLSGDDVLPGFSIKVRDIFA